jgi:hypothetical protein
MDLFGSEYGLAVGSCERDNEPLGSLKGRVFLELVSDC